MSIFDILTLFGGLALFLYGMRIMGDGLKEGSSGTLRVAMEKLTNTAWKAFLLGFLVTAVIQSSTATIVITAGLVAAGLLTFHQSIGILVGANVGTTVTGQIIRLMDLNGTSTAWLQIFKPSSLAPITLIAGIIIIMGLNFKGSKTVGQVCMGFGILFTGLMNMTNAVDTLAESGVFESMFSHLGSNPFLGYLTGLVVAFILQSSSATIGILQALSVSGSLTFKAIYAVLGGIYLGDCVTTAIVIWIGGKPDAKRVGIVNIIYNLFKTALVLVGVAIGYFSGLLSTLWDAPLRSGGIANVNTIFNLACALLLFPTFGALEKLTYKIVKDEPVKAGKYDEVLNELNPVFFTTPMVAFESAYDVLSAMLKAASENISKAFDVVYKYDDITVVDILSEEDNIDMMADRVSNYLIQFSAHINNDKHAALMDQYYKAATEFERLGDHATNIVETALALEQNKTTFSADALKELDVLRDLINATLDYTKTAFEQNSIENARHIEPLEEVVDDMVNALRDNHLTRLRAGKCSIFAGTEFLNMLTDIERISDVCSDVGVGIVARIQPELATEAHSYISQLHAGRDEGFNAEYHSAHDEYFGRLAVIEEEMGE